MFLSSIPQEDKLRSKAYLEFWFVYDVPKAMHGGRLQKNVLKNDCHPSHKGGIKSQTLQAFSVSLFIRNGDPLEIALCRTYAIYIHNPIIPIQF